LNCRWRQRQLHREMFCLLSPKKRLKCVYERASPQN
jgi:hypothetical protein